MKIASDWGVFKTYPSLYRENWPHGYINFKTSLFCAFGGICKDCILAYSPGKLLWSAYILFHSRRK